LVAAWLISLPLAYGLRVNEPLSKADAIVIFSGSAGYVERCRYAAWLFGRGVAPLIILTNDHTQGGWSNEQERNPLFVELAVAELRAAGVERDKILVLQDPVFSTFDDANVVRNYAEAHGTGKLLFVTSPYHSRRALWTVRRVFGGMNTHIGIETPDPGIQSPQPWQWLLSPSGWRQVALEYPKLFYYRLRY
jgi:uncharacterized SAM-binding protein YcdF (DUF218 family)